MSRNSPPLSKAKTQMDSTSSPRVLTVSTGTVEQIEWHGRMVPTGFRKRPRDGGVLVGPDGAEGDAQGDRKNHGGPDKALLMYPSEHYPRWRELLGDLDAPAFGENLTTEGVTEDSTVVGTVIVIGTATVQVTQPRRPCFKLAAVHGVEDLAVLTQRTGRTGFYARVLKPGELSAGQSLIVDHIPDHGITVAEVNRVLNIDRSDRDGITRILDHPGVVPEKWEAMLRRRLVHPETDDDSARLQGRRPPKS